MNLQEAIPSQNMWCYVSLPNSVVIEVEVDQKANGQDCLDEVCKKLGIIEVDYFGLQFSGSKGELLWLNMRNRITRQVRGSNPYRFKLKVKFFVQPHLLLQEETRHQFFLQIKQDFTDGQLKCNTVDTVTKLSALVAQADHKDYTNTLSDSSYCTNCRCPSPNTLCENISTNTSNMIHHVTHRELLSVIRHEHSMLNGMKSSTACYRMLELASTIENYGVEYHTVRDSNGQALEIGIGPEGIAVYKEDFVFIRSIPYPTVQMATHAGKCVFLSIVNDFGETSGHGFKLVSQKAANGLYRCVTEKHSFYRCDTVRNAVSAQFSRDLKGTLVSIFNENTQLGKKYIFDIRRTCREVHDHARRVLYTAGMNTVPAIPMETEHSQNGKSDEHDDVRERLEKLEENLLCRVCMDSSVNSVFVPCGHTCCHTCAVQLSQCPICRSQVDTVQHMYMTPISSDGL